MSFTPRQFERVLFMGSGDRSLAQAYQLVSMLMGAIDHLGGHQQPAHPTSEEDAKQASAEFIEGEVELRIRARDFARALTDREITFLATDMPVIGASEDWAAVTAEIDSLELQVNEARAKARASSEPSRRCGDCGVLEGHAIDCATLRDDLVRASHAEGAEFCGDYQAGETDRLMHRLWTKAVGTEGYDKVEWQHFEKLLFEMYARPGATERQRILMGLGCVASAYYLEGGTERVLEAFKHAARAYSKHIGNRQTVSVDRFVSTEDQIKGSLEQAARFCRKREAETDEFAKARPPHMQMMMTVGQTVRASLNQLPHARKLNWAGEETGRGTIRASLELVDGRWFDFGPKLFMDLRALKTAGAVFVSIKRVPGVETYEAIGYGAKNEIVSLSDMLPEEENDS